MGNSRRTEENGIMEKRKIIQQMKKRCKRLIRGGIRRQEKAENGESPNK